MSIEHRRDVRVTVGWPAFLDGGNGKFHKMKLTNISVSGLGLHCDLNMRKGMQLSLTVEMPNERLREPPVRMPIAATVVHAIIEGDFCRIGTTIDKIDPAHLAMLRRYIELNHL